MAKLNKKQIKQTIIFVFLFLLLLFLVEFSYELNFTKTKLDFYNVDLEVNSNLNYLFLGDSHTLNSVNDYILNTSSFNFGIPGTDYRESYLLFNYLLSEKNLNTNYLVLEIDTHSFSDKIRTKASLFRGKLFSSLFPISTMSKFNDETYIFNFIKKHFLVLGKIRNILNIFYLYFISYNNNPILVDSNILANNFSKNGFQIIYTDFSKNLVNKDLEKIIYFNRHYSNNLNLFENESFKYFLKTIDLAKENNISIIFINYPVSRPYYDSLVKFGHFNRTKHYSKLFSIINKSIIDYEYLDYYNLYFNNNSKFEDSSHLNIYGAINFTKILKRDLAKLESQS